MAKCTIVLEDNPDGTLSVMARFEPPLERAEDGTAAQQVAAAILDGVVSEAEEIETEYVDTKVVKGSN